MRATWFLIPIIFLISICCASTRTPLIKASEQGDTKGVQSLLKEGSPINGTDSNGATALMYAIWSQNSDIAKTLIEADANLNIRDKYGYSAIYYAVISNQYEIADILLTKGADVYSEYNNTLNAFLSAVNNCDEQMTEIFLKHGVDINMRNRKEAQTALHIAAMGCDGKMIGLLLKRGADPSLTDSVPWTPLDWAIYNSNIETAAVIRKATDWQENVDYSGMGDKLKSPSYYHPEPGMFAVLPGQERAFNSASHDCNVMIIPNKTGALIAAGPIGYGIGYLKDAITVKEKFQRCMEVMGFQCINNCSR